MLIISDKNIYGEVEKQMERIDFTNCRRILGKAYNGANGKKIAVEYEGVVYMLKFPPSAENKPTDLSYTNKTQFWIRIMEAQAQNCPILWRA